MASNATVIDPKRAAESNTAQILAVVTIFHVIALVFVSLRIYTRVFVLKAPGKDDACMVLSVLCATGGWIVFVIQSQHGLGSHQETITKDDMAVFQQAGFWQSIISATCALGFLKLSIGFNLLRLSTEKLYTWCLWVTMAFVMGYSFMGAMTFFLHCTPMAGHWDLSLQPSCYNLKLFVTFGLINTSFNIFTDMLFASFPIPIIWSLQMKRKLQMYVIGILSLGYFAVAMGVVKAVYQIAFSREPDKTFQQSVTFWGFLQLNVGIIAACAATLKPIVSRVLRLDTPRNLSDRYVYGSRSRSTRRETAIRPGKIVGDDLELENSGYGVDVGTHRMTDLKGGTSSKATFYKYQADEGSSSEEMILGLAEVEAMEGITKTTEVSVSVDRGSFSYS